MMKWVLALVLLASAAQVAYAQSAEVAQQPVAEAAPLVVIDARPEREHRRRALSINIVDCSYGIWNIGDDQINSIAQLQSDLSAQLGPAAAGKTVTVRRYAVMLNASARLTTVAVAAGAGSVGDFSSPTFSTSAKCAEERTPLGWFDQSELTTNFSPFVVQIEVDVDGHPYALRSVHSPATDLVYPRRIFRAEGAAEAVIAMTQANTQLAQLIAADASSSSEASPAQ